MRLSLSLLFTLFTGLLYAQVDSAIKFLERSLEKEQTLQSGEVNIRVEGYTQDSLLSQSEEKLTLYREPGNKVPHFILEDDKEGIYFSNGEAIESHYRGFRRQMSDPRWPDAYRWNVRNSMKYQSLGLFPDSLMQGPLKKLMNTPKELRDSLVQWNSLTQILRIKTLEIEGGKYSRHEIFEYEFGPDSLIKKVTHWFVQRFDEFSYTLKTVHHYSYSRLNQVPYFYIRQRLKEYQNAPLLSVFRPEPLKISQHPGPGSLFPDLWLMDGKGATKKLSSISGPKILIYHYDTSAFSFIDSMEDAHRGWTFMIITQHTIDDLDDYEKTYPTIHSFYLASKVDGLELNGFPVWFIVNKEGLLLAENHGYQSHRKKEFSEWIKEHLGDE